MRKLPVAIATAMKNAGVTKQSKYKAVPTVVDGIRFDSKAEAEYYKILIGEQLLGLVEYFIRQVQFDLPGGYKHRVDFLVFYPRKIGHQDYWFIEIKGKDIGTGKLKRKQVEEIYGIKIHVMRAKYRSGQITGFEEVEK